jgi:hypothetical protein
VRGGEGRGECDEEVNKVQPGGGVGSLGWGGTKQLGESKAKLDSQTGLMKARVEISGDHSRTKIEIRIEARNASGRVDIDGAGDGETVAITETKTNKVGDTEKSGTNGGADASGFDGGVVRVARNVTERSNKLGGTVEGRVLQEEVREVVKTTSFQISGFADGGGDGHQKINSVSGAAQRNRRERSARQGRGDVGGSRHGGGKERGLGVARQ